MENIIYFLNHIADQTVSSNRLGNNFLVMVGVPACIAIYIVLFPMKKARGNKAKLVFLISILYILCIVLPIAIVIHSLIFLGQFNFIFPAVMLFLFFGLVFTGAIEEYYPRFKYKTDEEYRAKTFIDGYHVKESIEGYKFLLLWNIIFFLAHLLYLIGIVLLLGSLALHIPAWTAGIILGVAAFITLLFLVWFRWYFRCPYCKNTIYGLESRRRRNYSKLLYLSVMFRILKYHRFTCMYCHGHFILGKRDIIKEHGWKIENLHEPDFKVIKS